MLEYYFIKSEVKFLKSHFLTINVHKYLVLLWIYSGFNYYRLTTIRSHIQHLPDYQNQLKVKQIIYCKCATSALMQHVICKVTSS